MKRKWLAVGIILLFLGTSIIPVMAQEIEKPLSPPRGNWLYVGGSGPGNYTRIQDAIDNASDGDTIFVYHGWYNDSIVIINKSLRVCGQERNITFISAGVIINDVANLEFKRFTIINANVENAIAMDNCVDCQIAELKIIGFARGIFLMSATSVRISNNTFLNCGYALDIEQSKNVTVQGNYIDNNLNGAYGIYVSSYITINTRITIRRNAIINYSTGIWILGALFIFIQENNFIHNQMDVLVYNSLFNVWQRNYWHRPHPLPKIILVILGMASMPPSIPLLIPIFNFDWHPALKPYDIRG
jgi:parallel beta-helix repeat protein